jgi:MFS family permease
MELGVFTVAGGMILATYTTQPWHLYLSFGVLVGFGSVCVGYSGQSLFLPSWFVRRRGLAMGIAFSGVGIGSRLLFPWIQRVIERDGWRTACWDLGLMVLIILAPLNLLLFRRPEMLGLTPDGDAASAAAAARHADIVDPAWAAIDWTLARAARTARFWWIALGYFGALFTFYAVQVHQTKYLVEIGFSATDAAWALGTVSLAGIPGGIALGYASDRIGREPVWALGCLGFVLTYVCLLLMRDAPSQVLLLLMVLAQGMLGYGITSVLGAITAEIFEGRHFGAIFGTLFLPALAGGAIGPWLTGVLHDRSGTYVLAFWIAAGAAVVSAAAIWRAAPRQIRRVAGRNG